MAEPGWNVSEDISSNTGNILISSSDKSQVGSSSDYFLLQNGVGSHSNGPDNLNDTADSQSLEKQKIPEADIVKYKDMEIEFLELKLRKLKIERQTNKANKFMMELLMKDVITFEQKVQVDGHGSPDCQKFLKECSQWRNHQSIEDHILEEIIKLKQTLKEIHEEKSRFTNLQEATAASQGRDHCNTTSGSNGSDTENFLQETNKATLTGHDSSNGTDAKILEDFDSFVVVENNGSEEMSYDAIKVSVEDKITSHISRQVDNDVTNDVIITSHPSVNDHIETSDSTIQEKAYDETPIINQQTANTVTQTTGQQTAYDVTPTTDSQTGHDINSTTGQQTAHVNFPTTGQQTAHVNFPTTGQQTAHVNFPTTGQQTAHVNLPTTGQQTAHVNFPTTGKQTAHVNFPTTGQQIDHVNFPTTGQQTGLVNFPTTDQQTAHVNFPTTGQQTDHVNFPTTGQQTAHVNFPTTGQQTAHVNIPTTGQQTAHVNFPTTGQQTAYVNFPTTGQQTALVNFPTTGQQTAHVNFPTTGQQTAHGIFPTTGQQTAHVNFPTTGQQTAHGIFPSTGQQTARGNLYTIGQNTAQGIMSTTGQQTDPFSITQGLQTENFTPSQVLEMEAKAKIDLSSVDLLLIGNSGNGKSATGNSILNSAAFKRSSASTVTSFDLNSSIMKASRKIKDKTINVIDGPSIDDCGKLQPEDLDKIIQAVDKSMELCNYGFTALLIVLKFGNRFTKQEAEAIRVIKSVLGKNVVRDYGVCVITHGDNFENAVEEAAEDGETLTFRSWLKEQIGEVKKLFDECNYRCVLFDNMTKDSRRKEEQFENLLSILPQGKRYSNEEFFQSEEGQQELSMETNLPLILKDIQNRVQTAREKINQIERVKGDDVNAYKHSMELVAFELQEQKEILKKMGITSPDVESMKLLLSALEIEINLKIKQSLTSSKIKEHAENQNRFSPMGAPKSGYESYQENQSAFTEIEALNFIHSLKLNILSSEKISDGDQYRSVMLSFNEILLAFNKNIKSLHSGYEWVNLVLAESDKLKNNIDFNIQKSFSSKCGSTHENRSGPVYDVALDRDKDARSLTTVHFSGFDGRSLAQSKSTSIMKRMEIIAKRVYIWFNSRH